MSEAAAAQSPMTVEIGDISMITEKGIKISHYPMVFLNGHSVEAFKVGEKVTAKIQGDKLVSIEKRTDEPAPPQPTKPAEMKSGSGKVVQVDLNKPYFEYSYIWQGNTTSSRFFQMTDAAKEQLKAFKPGDEITATWTVHDGNKKTLQGVTVKGSKPFGGGGFKGTPRDPVAEAKTQTMIVKQNTLDRSVQLWINGNPGKEPTEADDERILKRMEKYAARVMQ